jgi:glutaredoxin-related protein
LSRHDSNNDCNNMEITWQTLMIIKPLISELNNIRHLLVLLEDLKYMGPCILSIFQYISKKIECHTVYLYLKTALHVSCGTSTHHHERIQLYLQHLVFVTPLLLSAAIVEELEPVSVWRTPPTAHSNRSQLFHDSGR